MVSARGCVPAGECPPVIGPWHRRAIAAGAALAIDRAVGEPPVPGWLHPVALFGRAMTALEQRVYDDRRTPGALLAGAGVGLAGAAGAAIRSPLLAAYVSTAALAGVGRVGDHDRS
jgi:cobalamin biosynthesis protein CobD/CbiB